MGARLTHQLHGRQDQPGAKRYHLGQLAYHGADELRLRDQNVNQSKESSVLVKQAKAWAEEVGPVVANTTLWSLLTTTARREAGDGLSPSPQISPLYTSIALCASVKDGIC